MSKRNVSDTPILQLEMPDIVGLPRNWEILIEYLRQRRYTSGDVEACIGVSRKVLKDWDGAGIMDQLYQGLGSGRGNERFGKWRLFSIFDVWNLAFYKRLRDVGIDIARLRGVKKANPNEVFEGGLIQWWFYQALPSWIYRQPYWVHSDLEKDVGYTSIERKNAAIYFVRIAHVESMGGDLFITVNLVPLMDKVMALKGPLGLTLDKIKGITVRVEEEELRLEPLPKPEDP
ncbi:MAG TPA: hypothetical protein PKN47_22420 [Nitrospira sp.]|jgi:hypothetical protein|nr:hypothetical protein [Nitrospira sp.]